MDAGYGQGTGSNYVPWLSVRDVPSKGYRTMVFSKRLGRTVNLLSLLELGAFVVAEANERYVEIYEQCPKDRDVTRLIAKRLGYRHPSVAGTDIVMTSDFQITEEVSLGKYRRFVRSAKQADQLRRWRPVQKLEIERDYQNLRGDGFETIDEHQLPRSLVNNLRWLRQVHRQGVMAGYSHELLEAVAAYLEGRIWSIPFGKLCRECDSSLDLPPHLRSIRAAQYLISTHRWPVDLRMSIEAHRPLVALS